MSAAPGTAPPDDVHRVASAALDDIAAARDVATLEAVRARYLGRSDGLLTVFRRGIGAIADPDAKRSWGQTVNELVARVSDAVDERRGELAVRDTDGGDEASLDLTWPPPPLRRGHLHPVSRVARDIRRIFGQLGYVAVDGPEVEYDRYNFTLVNMPPGHPSRATQDTFFIDDDRVLRTHTSPVQVRSMLTRGAPQRVIVPGKAYRRDYDATHFPMFFQVEGMCIDEGIALSDLKGTLDFGARSLFGADRRTRLRPHHFEFTEPSVELDVSCGICGGAGCRLCKGTGWLEVLGGGMIHPNVLRNGGVDPVRYSGFAFGMGLERTAILAHGVEDGRLLYENDVRFLGAGVKVSLEWLREYAVLDAPLDTLVEALIETGTEVDAVQRGPAGVIVARVTALSAVPESTKGVQFADLDVGDRPAVRVLTGASNLAVGDLVPYAPPGTLLPGWEKPLEVRAMFGGKYHSPGMLCSALELGLGSDAAGIHHLDSGEPGQALADVIALDTVLDVEVTTNRPDCLCHVGMAREMAAAIGETVREPSSAVADGLVSAASLAQRATVEVVDPDGCPRFAVRIIENVAVQPSPDHIQRRLRAVGLRPINNVVDITNYVAHELGQPLHAFDLDRFLAVQGDDRMARVSVRRGRAEPVLCLDGVERTAGPEDMVVCAGDVAVSLGGVIGGATTAVDDNTRNVLLEAATWDGPTIRATSARLGVRTDASTLNEKGLSDTLPPQALDRAAALIAELAGGHVLQDSVDVRARQLPVIPPIAVDGAAISRVLGYPVDTSEAATVLARLGFGVEQDGAHLTVAVPHFRRDVWIAEDVVEEVGRLLGYDRVPSTLPGRRVPSAGTAAPEPPDDTLKDVLIGAGFDEAITWSFVSPSLASSLAGAGEGRVPIPLRNPLSEEWSVMRTSLLAGVLQALAGNLRHDVDDVRLFELGRAFWEGERTGPVPGSTADGADDALVPLPAEPLLLAMVATARDASDAAAGLRELQAVVGRGARDVGTDDLRTVPAAIPGFRAGRCGRLVIGDTAVGIVGELSPEVLGRFDIRGRVVAAELVVDGLPRPDRQAARRYHAPPRHPAVVEDLAVTVPAAALAADALEAISDGGGDLLESATLYDEYRGRQAGEGRKGWTFRLVYRAPDRTLTSEEAHAVREGIAAELARRCGAEVRR